MIVSKYRSIEVTKDNIISKVPEDLVLSDNVISFNYKGEWIIIPMYSLVKYPIIYFYDEDTKEYGSIVCCLLTLRTMYVYEKVRWIGYEGVEARFNNEAGESMGFESKLDKNGEKIVEFKRSHVKIQNLRSALIEYGDLKYLKLNIPENKSNLIPMNYYSNMIDYTGEEINMSHDKLDYHPKSLCLLIQYHSKSSETGIKTSIIISKDSNKTDDNGYEPRKGGFDNYLTSSTDKLIEKKAFIMHILYYAAKIIYKDTVKYIKL
jgi:hypothetical protein